jgi:L-histidine N-alpha-methyltransferase
MTPEREVAALEAAGLEMHAVEDWWTALASDVLHGLLSMPKTLPPKWFYDARGSDLFEQITELDEYYLTRRERSLLRDIGPALASEVQATELVELGSGSSAKTPLLLDALMPFGLERYVPVDVSATAVDRARPWLAERYPGLEIRADISDFTREVEALRRPSAGPRLVAFLGSTLGNFQPVEVRALLSGMRPDLRPADALLIGTDLVKSVEVLEAAYDDPGGITAAFNKNVLAVINRELAADFELDAFEHEAAYNRELDRIEIRLRSREQQLVRIQALGIEVPFLQGESVLTEISRKFTRETVERAYVDAGFRMREWYEDSDGWYGLSLASPASPV